MTVAFFYILFSISRSFIFFWRALYSFKEIVSSSVVITGARFLIHVETVPFGMPYSLLSSVTPLPALQCRSTICCLNSGVYDFWFLAIVLNSFFYKYSLFNISCLCLYSSTNNENDYLDGRTFVYYVGAKSKKLAYQNVCCMRKVISLG